MITTVLAECPTCGPDQEMQILECDECPADQCVHLKCLTCGQDPDD